MEEMKDFEALVNAIKESSKPVTELATILKSQLTPVQSVKLRDKRLHKVTIGNKSFEVDYLQSSGDYSFNKILVYSIRNEITSSADCVALSKDMLFECDNMLYKVAKVVISKDILLVGFDIVCDAVLIS